jgi:hypothetical protein
MSGESSGTWVQFWDYTDRVAEAPPAEATSQLGVQVIFTSEQGTRAALRAAAALASDLRVLVNLLAFQHVPLSFPLSRPPVSIAFSQQRLVDLANQAPSLSTVVRLYLCRNKRLALAQALPPGSLVVVGGKRRAWPTREERLEKQLARLGHQVIFAELK